MLEVVFRSFGDNLNENPQNFPVRFAYLSDKNEQCHDFVKCRDYLHDVLYSTHNKRPSKIYGFYYDPKIHPAISTDNLRLLVKYPNVAGKGTCGNALKLINFYEKLGKFEGVTVVEPVVNTNTKEVSDEVVAFTSPKEWISFPGFMSFYTLLIRLAKEVEEFNSEEELCKAYDKIKAKSTVDATYVQKISPIINLLFKHRDKVFSPFMQDGIYKEYSEKSLPIDTIHNRRGVLSLCVGSYKDFPMKYLLDTLEDASRQEKEEVC